MAEQRFFKTLWEGNVAPEKIVTEIITDSLIRTYPSEAWIEDEWQKLLKGGFKPWPNDTKPTRYRFCGVEEKDGKLVVTLDPCVSYRDFIGSNTPEFVERFGEDCNPHPLAVSAVITTSDQKILLTVRKNVDYKVGGYHASIGGFMDIRKEEDPVSALYREIKEECGIEDSELKNARCLGVAYNPWTVHTDILFSAMVNVESGEIKKRVKNDDGENECLFFISATRSSIEELLTNTSHANCGISSANLLLVGKYVSGWSDQKESPDEWYNRMVTMLAEESKDYDSARIRAELEARDITRFQEMIKRA